jgi:hypothetical protein
MNDSITVVLVLLAILVGFPVALLLARDWWNRPSKKEAAAFSQRFLHRLQHPDFAAVEQELGKPLPAILKAFYSRPEELLRANFALAASAQVPVENRWFVADYQPLDAEAIRDRWPGLERYVAFADDGAGNGYLIEPGSDDPPVLFHDHETGEIIRVCERLSEFLQWPRFPVSG